MIDIIKNVSKITTIPKTQLDDLMDKINNCIAHEALQFVDDIDVDNIELDVGFGLLYITYRNNELTYRFIPSPKLEKVLISTMRCGESPLVNLCEEKITSRILTTYKDIL